MALRFAAPLAPRRFSLFNGSLGRLGKSDVRHRRWCAGRYPINLLLLEGRPPRGRSGCHNAGRAAQVLEWRRVLQFRADYRWNDVRCDSITGNVGGRRAAFYSPTCGANAYSRLVTRATAMESHRFSRGMDIHSDCRPAAPSVLAIAPGALHRSHVDQPSVITRLLRGEMGRARHVPAQRSSQPATVLPT